VQTWFTSDTHFGHANLIIKYHCRPFADPVEMDETMIARWNERVAPGDTVYHLGDFALGPKAATPVVLARLNGHKILVIGNHDRKPDFMKASGFAEVHESLSLNLNGHWIYLTHQPVPPPEGTPCDYHLHGHVHKEYARLGNAINVGVDVLGFRPLTLEELLVRDPQ
jgi:calcineurin-like phosphoesterase family protein